MSDIPEKSSQLGRGLSALLGEDSADYASLDRVRLSKMVPIEFVHPNPYQPRHRFDDDAIDALVESIKERGIIQPIIVRRHPETPNAYEIVAGERRWRAAQKAQLHEVPVLIKDLTDSESLEIALVENIQRQNLSPLEEAEGYRRLMEEYSYVQEDLARAVGKSRSHVANTMRLLALPESVKEMLDAGALSAGHGRALLNAASPEALAHKVVKDGLNVRQTERLAQAAKTGSRPGKAASAAPKDADTLALERDLSNLLGLKVTIKFRHNGGELTVHYRTLEQLDDVLHRLQHHHETSNLKESDDSTVENDDTLDRPLFADNPTFEPLPDRGADAVIGDGDEGEAVDPGVPPANRQSEARSAIEELMQDQGDSGEQAASLPNADNDPDPDIDSGESDRSADEPDEPNRP